MLNDEMRAELERRLAVIADERAGAPGTRETRRADVVWLVVILVLACLAVPLMQAG